MKLYGTVMEVNIKTLDTEVLRRLLKEVDDELKIRDNIILFSQDQRDDHWRTVIRIDGVIPTICQVKRVMGITLLEAKRYIDSIRAGRANCNCQGSRPENGVCHHDVALANGE